MMGCPPISSGLRRLVTALDETINRRAPVPDARPNFHPIWWLPEEAPSPYRGD